MLLELDFEESLYGLNDERKDTLHFDKVLKYIDRGQQLPNLIDIAAKRTKQTLKKTKRFSSQINS